MEERNKNYIKYIKESGEARCGFKVTSNRKKIWNIQLGLLEELKRICKKYNIKYYADGGTLLGAVRHKGYIPWDDDIDIVIFREDYERLLEKAPHELKDGFNLRKFHGGFSKLVNINTTALGDNNRRDEDYIGGIRIDIFPIDYASKYLVINRAKAVVLTFFRMILYSQKSYGSIEKINDWTKNFYKISKYVFKNINCEKVYKIHEALSKKVFFKGKNVFSSGFVYRFFPEAIYEKSHEVMFEKTTICIPDGYDVYLKKAYGDYMKPVIYEGGHNCRYSVDKSYKDIIKSFDKNKSNEDNYNSCKDLFVL